MKLLLKAYVCSVCIRLRQCFAAAAEMLDEVVIGCCALVCLLLLLAWVPFLFLTQAVACLRQREKIALDRVKKEYTWLGKKRPVAWVS